MKIPISPCNPTGEHDCEQRRVGCRSACEKWQKFEAEKKAFNEEKCRVNAERDVISDYIEDSKTKRFHKKGRESKSRRR